MDVVLLRSGGMAENACKALRARPLTSGARRPEPLPCAVGWALYLGPACTCGPRGRPRTIPSGVSHVVVADAAPALTRPGLGAARAQPPPTVEAGRPGATWLPFSLPPLAFLFLEVAPAAYGPPSFPPNYVFGRMRLLDF